MTNQASEDELKKRIGNLHAYNFDGDDVTVKVMVDEGILESIAKFVEAFIRTEKLKLLDEVRERVVGEGDLVDAEILKKLYDKAYSNGYDDKGYENSYNSRDYRSAEDIAPVIAKIRGGYDKRLAALTKLEAEL